MSHPPHNEISLGASIAALELALEELIKSDIPQCIEKIECKGFDIIFHKKCKSVKQPKR